MPTTPQLINHRWVIPANASVTLRIRFRSEELGQFDQTLNFEIMGTRRRYQLFCRGVCAFPTISREPRVVFPHRKKYRKPEEVVHKKYVLSNETFEFGPLLCGKFLQGCKIFSFLQRTIIRSNFQLGRRNRTVVGHHIEFGDPSLTISV